ncbi:MAG: SET domain-containing protein [Patescibacteria group bacterium]
MKLVTAADVLAHLRAEVFVRIQRSPKHGVGIFAIRDIPAGIDPFQTHRLGLTFVWCPIDALREDPTIPTEVERYVMEMCIRKDGMVRLPSCGMNGIMPRYYMNHGDDPNVCVGASGDFETIRSIAAGEELTTNYFTYSEEPELPAELQVT